MRERKQHQIRRLTLPPPSSHRSLNNSPLSSSSSTTSTSSASPGVDSLSDLTKHTVLGRGSGGVVYKVSHNKNASLYAMKVVRCHDDDSLEQALREAEILRRVDSSDHVVRCLAVFEGGAGEELCFVMEYMDAGSLRDILSKTNRLPEKMISGMVKSVLKGLQYLHGQRIVHGDIKPSNLLANSKGEVKLADFGASWTVSIAGGGGDRAAAAGYDRGTCTGTYAYMSPERMDPERWDGGQSDGYAGDVWSVGVVAMECYAGRFPFAGAGKKVDWVTLMCAVCFEEDMERAVKMGPPEFESFCRRCLERDWRRRGTVEELLLHPFVNRSDSEGIHVDQVVDFMHHPES